MGQQGGPCGRRPGLQRVQCVKTGAERVPGHRGHIGIGRALLQQKQFKEACDYFAMARDSRNYSEAFRYYRSEWVEQNIGWIFGIVAVLLVVPMVVGHIRKIKWEVDNA